MSYPLSEYPSAFHDYTGGLIEQPEPTTIVLDERLLLLLDRYRQARREYFEAPIARDTRDRLGQWQAAGADFATAVCEALDGEHRL